MSTRGSGNVSVPVLSKTIVSTSAKPLDSVAGIENHAGLRNSAPEATTWTAGIASASAHGQVMISTAIAVINASCTEAPAISQPTSVNAAVSVHDRRIEPRGAIGKPHGSAISRLTALSSSRSTSSISVPIACGRHPHGDRT